MCAFVGDDTTSLLCFHRFKRNRKILLSAIYCVTRCVLFPGTKIVVTAPTKSQGILILEKIENEILPNAPLLQREIAELKTGNQNQLLYFKTVVGLE